MPLPKVTGPDTTITTDIPFDFGPVRIVLKVGYIAGNQADAITQQGRQTNLQRLIDARTEAVQALVEAGTDQAEAEAKIPEPVTAPVLVDDVAVPMIAAAVKQFYATELDHAPGLGDDNTHPDWEPFTLEDAEQIWNGLDDDAWPEWARTRLWQSVQNMSKHGSANPKAQ